MFKEISLNIGKQHYLDLSVTITTHTFGLGAQISWLSGEFLHADLLLAFVYFEIQFGKKG